eukprot:TRINITY_DN3973_c0_g1_i4.p1 TRINITY_DN3973_c0_g1~~TRINITY_DN3973_c0_g1_i4.p1  ORF type:complete len:1170 (+),score=353.01 TRINITY_DN3973_c0_g1_i4:74-3583(+)
MSAAPQRKTRCLLGASTAATMHLTLLAAIVATCWAADGSASAASVNASAESVATATKVETLQKAANKLEDKADISVTGKCKEAITSLCGDVERGDGAVAACLKEKMKAARARREKSPLSMPCRFELSAFTMAAVWNKEKTKVSGENGLQMLVSPTKHFREYCGQDAKELCPDKTGPEVLTCLKKRKAEIKDKRCQHELGRFQREQAQDIRLDPLFFEACSGDLQSIASCKRARTTANNGVQKACLKRHREELSEKCRQRLFDAERIDAEDLRNDADVMKTCQSEVTNFCKDVAFGNARMASCLWMRKENNGFSIECKEKIVNLTRRAVSDFRLDFRVHQKCNSTMDAYCSQEVAQVKAHASSRGVVVQCLKQNYNRISNEECMTEIMRVVRVQSEDPLADPLHQKLCKEDITKHCNLRSSRFPGVDLPNPFQTVRRDKLPQRRVHICLRKHIDELSDDCRDAELTQGFIEAHSSGMKWELTQLCGGAIEKYCKDMPTGKGQAITCLQNHFLETDFPANCAQVVAADLQASNHDWRLKYGMSEKCRRDAENLCPQEVDNGGVKLLTCLKDNLKVLTNRECTGMVRDMVKQGMENIKATPETDAACVGDVEELCPEVTPGGGGVHRCLVKYRMQLSQPCRKAVFKLQKLRSSDMSLAGPAMQKCKGSIAKLCRDTEPGEGRLWNCLEKQHTHPDMADSCRKVVEDHIELKNSEFNLNPQLEKHCEKDAASLCPDEFKNAEDEDFTSNGALIGCLIVHRNDVKKDRCKQGLLIKQRQRVESLKNDPAYFEACNNDAWSLCEEEMYDGSPGVVRKCLAESRDQLSEGCLQVQEKVEAMQAEDIRLNPRLERNCHAARKQYCGDVDPGTGRVISCLLDHMHGSGMDGQCQESLVKEVEKRSRSVDNNPNVMKQCAMDMKALVNTRQCSQSTPSKSRIPSQKTAPMLNCLLENRKSIQSSACLSALLKVQKLQSEDVRAKGGMKQSCKADMDKFCGQIRFGAGRMHECLRKHLDELQNEDCKEMVKKVQLAESTNALINPKIRRFCKNERKAFCNGVEAGNARVLVCLKSHKDDEGFSSECRGALTKVDLSPEKKKQVKGLRNADDARVQAAVNEAISEIKAWLLAKAPSFEDGSGTFLAGGIIGAMVACAFTGLAISLACRRCKKNYAELPDTV